MPSTSTSGQSDMNWEILRPPASAMTVIVGWSGSSDFATLAISFTVRQMTGLSPEPSISLPRPHIRRAGWRR